MGQKAIFRKADFSGITSQMPTKRDLRGCLSRGFAASAEVLLEGFAKLQKLFESNLISITSSDF
jgi:hypothetical protein